MPEDDDLPILKKDAKGKVTIGEEDDLPVLKKKAETIPLVSPLASSVTESGSTAGNSGSSGNLDYFNGGNKDSGFNDWYKANTLEGKSGIPYSDKLDYDYESFYKNNGVGSIKKHFPDTYKRPTHPTFSNESIYSTFENPGGSWDKNGNFVKPLGAIQNDKFTGTPEVNTDIAPLNAVASQIGVTLQDQNNYSDKERQKPTGEIREALMRGTARLGNSFLKSPAFLYDALTTLTNKVVNEPLNAVTGNAFGAMPTSEEISKKLPASNPVSDLDAAVENSTKRYQEKYDKGVSEYIKQGDYGKAFEVLGTSIAETAPTMIALMTGNAAGISSGASTAAGTAVFGADKYSDVQKQQAALPEDQRMSTADQLGVSAANGFFEGLFEQYGVTKIGGIVASVAKDKGAAAAAKVAKEGFMKAYGPIMSKYLGVAAEEPLSEMATQFAQNAVDKYSGLKPDLDLKDGVMDAGIIGFAMGAGMSGAASALELSVTRNAVKRAGELKDKKEALEEDLGAQDVTPETKQAIANKIRDINEEEAQIASSERKKIEALTPEGKQEVTELLEKSHKASSAALDESISEGTRTALEEEVEKIDDQIETVLREKTEAKANKPEEEKIAKGDIDQDQDELSYLTEVESNFGLSPEEYTRKLELERSGDKNKADEETKKGSPVDATGVQESQTLEASKNDSETAQTTTPEAVNGINKSSESAPEIKGAETKTEPNHDEVISDLQSKITKNKNDMLGEKITIKQYNDLNDSLHDELIKAKVKKAEEAQKVSIENEKEEPKKSETNVTETIGQGEVNPGETSVEATAEMPAKESIKKDQGSSVEQSVEQKNVPVKPADTEENKIEEKPEDPEPDSSVKPKKEKISNKLVEEDEADTEDVVKNDPDILKKMDDDIETMKKMSTDDLAEKKYVGMVSRAWEAMNGEKIGKRQYNAFKKKAEQILEGKVASKDNVDALEVKARVSASMKKLKDRLTPDGNGEIEFIDPKTKLPYKVKVKKKGVSVDDLIDLVTSLIHRGIDAGFDITDAIDKAMKSIKLHPVYKRAVKEGELDEKAFEEKVRESSGEMKPVEIEKKKKTDKEAGIDGEQRERATNDRIYDNERFKDASKELDANLDVYDSVSQDKAIAYIDKKLNEFADEGLLYDLAAEINTLEGAKIFPESVSLMVPVILADRLTTMAEKEGNDMQKDVLNKLAAKTLDVWRQKTTSIAQQLGLTSFVNRYMPKSKAGMKSRVQNELSAVQDSYMDKETKKQVNELQGEVTGQMEPGLADKVKKMVSEEINRIAESLKGKEWVKNVNSALDDLKIDLTDC